MAGMDFSSLRKRAFANPHAQDRRLLEQFFVTLDATLEQLVRTCGDVSGKDEIAAEVSALLAGEPSWRNAYHAEQLMVPLYAGASLEVEIRRRMIEMRKFDTAVAAAYDELLADADEAGRRACLGRLVNDLQWRYEQRNLKRFYGQSVTIRTSLIFVAAFIVFFLPKNVLDAALVSAYGRHVALYMAIASGLLGASFSMLIGLRQRLAASSLDELRNTNRLPFLLSRAFIGAGAGMILFYVMESNLLEGKILPDIAQVVAYLQRGEAVQGGAANAALLVLWCFISGFSEHFVPNLLARTEAQLEGQASPKAEVTKPES